MARVDIPIEALNSLVVIEVDVFRCSRTFCELFCPVFSTDHDQPFLFQSGRFIELAFGRGNAFGIFMAVVISDETEVDVAAGQLIQENFGGGLASGIDLGGPRTLDYSPRR